ncbi:MAG: VWA domain-containing protein [Acidobacteria bacterium]|nr:VWA domain-containing protein [Acidobacteriota bacterium]
MKAFVPLAAAIGLLTAITPAQQPPTFKSGAKTVAVYATATDKDGRLVPNLTREDFEVKDGGKPVPITVFSNEIQPISVVMMLDRSGSMRGNFALVEAAGEAFVRALLPADKARIGSFAEKIQIDPENFTSDKPELIRVLRTKLQEQGPTPLWNSVDASIATLKSQEGRKVVLVFTDGGDNPGNFKLNNLSFMDIARRSQVADVMVYAIGLESAGRPSLGGGGLGGGGGFGGSRPDPGLPAIAGETGGGYFELRRAEDLATTFARVADELHRQYLIGFEPAKLDDKMHKLEVRVGKSGMKIRARREYYAAK